MHTKLPMAAAGLALALVLAVFGAGASSAGDAIPVGAKAIPATLDDEVAALQADDGPTPTIELDDSTAADASDEAASDNDASEGDASEDDASEQAAAVPTTAAPAPTTTAPAPTTTAPPATGGSMQDIVARHFGAAAQQAFNIIQCESNWNPNAVSPTNDHGLFQINAVHASNFTAVTGASWSQVYDPELNTIYAKYLYDQSGWGPWSCA